MIRFIHASTIGALDRTNSDPCSEPLDESAVPNPTSDYGKSKLKAEYAVKESGLPFTIIRISWAFGKGMTPDTHVRKLMQSVYNKKIVTFFNFPGKVSLITAEDLANAFCFAAEDERALNETYFITDGEPISIGNLFQLIGDAIGRKAGFVPIPKVVSAVFRKLRKYFPLVIQNLNSDVLTASNSKIKLLGFNTKLTKKQGIDILAKSLNYYKRNNE